MSPQRRSWVEWTDWASGIDDQPRRRPRGRWDTLVALLLVGFTALCVVIVVIGLISDW
jgi:hypothetical protein